MYVLKLVTEIHRSRNREVLNWRPNFILHCIYVDCILLYINCAYYFRASIKMALCKHNLGGYTLYINVTLICSLRKHLLEKEKIHQAHKLIIHANLFCVRKNI